MTVALIYDPAIESYRFPAGHPLRPERFSLAVALMRAWGLLAEDGERSADPGTEGAALGPRAPIWSPRPASAEEIALVHSEAYIAAVRAAGADPWGADPAFGLGAGDTPGFYGMHEAGALVAGATIAAVEVVLRDRALRAFSPAGGLHHAHRDRAAGFCVYNDCAIAIERATRIFPGVQIAYVDIDAHHGDGVQEAFLRRPDVLTVSMHESGRYLYPGTGFAPDIGEGPGTGFALNVPLPPQSGDVESARAFDELVAPAVRRFAPDLIVAQLGADSHFADPLTHLNVTIEGHQALVRRVVALADECCAGKLAATGGGGYEPFSVVPRIWAVAMAEMLGAHVPEELPAEWLAQSCAAAGWDEPPATLTFDDGYPGRDPGIGALEMQLDTMIRQVREASPLLGG